MIKTQLDALRFVLRNEDRGLVRVFGCLHFYGGRVQTSSGIITLDAPWPGTPLAITVPMQPVVKVMEAAPDASAKIVVNKNGHLVVKVASYSAKLVVFQEEFPRQERSAHTLKDDAHITADVWNGEVAHAIELLKPFLALNITRPWAQYMLLREGKLYATNNVVLARYALPQLTNIPYDVVLDIATIEHILRIRALGHEVSSISVSATELLCDFDDGAWAAYRSSAITWPSTYGFDKVLEDGEDVVAPTLAEQIDTIAGVAGTETGGVVYLYEQGAITQMEAAASARVACGTFPRGAYMRTSLQQALTIADKWTPSRYPAPVPFSGQGVQGVILGMRNASDVIDTLLHGDDANE